MKNDMSSCVRLTFIINSSKNLYYVVFSPKRYKLSFLALLWVEHLIYIVYSVFVIDCYEEQL